MARVMAQTMRQNSSVFQKVIQVMLEVKTSR